MKNYYILGLLIFIIFFVDCKQQDNKPICELAQYSDVRYFKKYFEDNSGNNTFYVDSIGLLYSSLNLYKIDDSSLVFMSYYNMDRLFIINADSIRVYSPQGEDPRWFTRDIYDMLNNSNIDSVIRYIGSVIYPFYSSSLTNKKQVIIGVEKKNCNRIVFVDYRNRAYFYCGGFFHNCFIYEKTIENNLINMSRVKLKNHDIFNNNIVPYDSLVKYRFAYR